MRIDILLERESQLIRGNKIIEIRFALVDFSNDL